MTENIADLFLRLSDPLYRLAYSRLGRKSDAEEVVQDVFVALLRKRPPQLQDGYLFQAVRNRCLDRLRRENRGRQLCPDWIEVSELDPADRERWLELVQALPSLSEEQREVLVLRSFCGLTLAEIASLQEVPVTTVSSRHRYALDHLRKQLRLSAEEAPTR